MTKDHIERNACDKKSYSIPFCTDAYCKPEVIDVEEGETKKPPKYRVSSNPKKTIQT